MGQSSTSAHIDLDQAHTELQALQQVKERHAMAMRKLETLEQELKDANSEKKNTQEQLVITQERITQLTSAVQERVLEGATLLAQRQQFH